MVEYTSYTDELSYDISFVEKFLSEDRATQLYNYLEENCEWSKPITTNRRSNQTYGDDGLVYNVEVKDKVIRRVAQKWLPPLAEIRDEITKLTGQTYNSCVVQRYPESVGIVPHMDKEMVAGTMICGVSLGETRKLVMIRRGQKSISIPLPHGSLYILNPPTNDYWMHSISKSGGVRISLTIRNYTG